MSTTIPVDPVLFVLYSGLLMLATVWATAKACRIIRDKEPLLSSYTKNDPYVVVQMPPDAQPLDRITGRGKEVITGEEAILWITVFEMALDDINCDVSDARDAADAAVDKVFKSRRTSSPSS